MDLTKILKNCPKNTELYSISHGKVYLQKVCDSESEYPILCSCQPKSCEGCISFTKDGRYNILGECVLFPSKNCRDWNQFKSGNPINVGDYVLTYNCVSKVIEVGDDWYLVRRLSETGPNEYRYSKNNVTKLTKFDVELLRPFDKVLVRDHDNGRWKPNFFGFYDKDTPSVYKFMCTDLRRQCIPYNEETKSLLGTDNACPEFYKTW